MSSFPGMQLTYRILAYDKKKGYKVIPFEGTNPKEFKTRSPALADVAQWTERWPANQRVASSIPSWGV